MYRISTVNPGNASNSFRYIYVLKYKKYGDKTALLVYPMTIKFFRKNGFSRQVRSEMRHYHRDALKRLQSQQFENLIKS